MPIKSSEYDGASGDGDRISDIKAIINRNIQNVIFKDEYTMGSQVKDTTVDISNVDERTVKKTWIDTNGLLSNIIPNIASNIVIIDISSIILFLMFIVIISPLFN